jgi:hypothetical protein
MTETLSTQAMRLSKNTKNEHYKDTSLCLERCSRELDRLEKALEQAERSLKEQLARFEGAPDVQGRA